MSLQVLLSEIAKPQNVFKATTVVLPAWILLVLAPRWRTSRNVVYLSMAVLSFIYVLLLIQPIQSQGILHIVEQFFSFSGVVGMFKSVDGVLIGWIHFCVMDLAGALWIVSDSHSRRIHHIFVIPALAVSFFFGPAGVLLYLLVLRPLFTRRLEDEKLPSSSHGHKFD